MSKYNKDNIKVESLTSLFGGLEAKENEDRIEHIPLSELHTFSNHPFKVEDNEDMKMLVDSIKENGVLNPIIVRRKDMGFEIIAGHRRTHASKRAGLSEIPALVKSFSDDEAVITMVDTNIQREFISIGEKAKAYKMRYDAMKHQGVGDGSGSSLNVMSEELGESRSNIQRLLKIAELSDEYLDLLNSKKIGVAQGVIIAGLSKEEQDAVYSAITSTGKYPSMNQAEEMRDLSKSGDLSESIAAKVLVGVKKEQKRRVVLKEELLNKYFDEMMTSDEILEEIESLLRSR